VDFLLGNPAKANRILGWSSSTSFSALVEEMVTADLALVDCGDMRS
jgi:GDPmannose 4,6-dehydratase